jgi:lipopolysaccharide export system protein LptC
MRRRLRLLAIAALLLVAATLLWHNPAVFDSNPLDEDLLAEDFDYFLQDMQLDRFAPDGSLQYHLAAERVTHFPEPEYSLLEQPSLHWFDPQQPDWTLQARQGDLRQDASGTTRLLLQEDVVARRAPGEGATLTLRSASLLVLPDSGEASTGDEVFIEDVGTDLHGSGMQAWMREGRIRLGAGSGRHE